MALEKPLDIREIIKTLPHAYPFLLIDRVLDYEVSSEPGRLGSWIKCLKNITFNEPYFPGHFPGKPILPGVLIVESMAQTGAFLSMKVNEQEKDDGSNWNFVIMGLKNVKFRAPIIPGDSVEVEAKVLKCRQDSVFLFECYAKVDGKVVTEAEILAKRFKTED